MIEFLLGMAGTALLLAAFCLGWCVGRSGPRVLSGSPTPADPGALGRPLPTAEGRGGPLPDYAPGPTAEGPPATRVGEGARRSAPVREDVPSPDGAPGPAAEVPPATRAQEDEDKRAFEALLRYNSADAYGMNRGRDER